MGRRRVTTRRAPPELRGLLATEPWFGSCPADFQQALVDAGRLHRLADGERLFGRGDAADGLCCVTAGALRMGSMDEDGGVALLASVEPYQWFGEISMLDGLARTHDAEADGPAEVLLVPREALWGWLQDHPAHWRDLARLACGKLRQAFDVLEDIQRLPLDQRLMKRLWLQSRGFGSRPARRKLRLPQDQLALMMGVSRQSVNRALQALEAQGRISLHYGTIELLGEEPPT
jgi:CRP-like cAMP-binding protein